MSESSNSKAGTQDAQQLLGWRQAWWPRVRAVGKGITGLAGLGAAIVAIYAWFPLARDSAWPELKEYETIKPLYAGASVHLFEGQLGPPSIVRVIPGESGLTQRLYAKKDYVVQTLATAEGETKLYSVLSCKPNFKPAFQFFNIHITLYDDPLSSQMPPDRPPSYLHYLQPRTVSSQKMFFELITSTSNATDQRGAGYGVNGVCQDLPTSSSGGSAPDYSGPPDQAPPEIRDYRERTPPNFYVEFRDLELAPETYESFVLPFGYATPSHVELPPGWPKS